MFLRDLSPKYMELTAQKVIYLIYAGFLLRFLFDPEDGGGM
jgi:hypothetical protein